MEKKVCLRIAVSFLALALLVLGIQAHNISTRENSVDTELDPQSTIILFKDFNEIQSNDKTTDRYSFKRSLVIRSTGTGGRYWGDSYDIFENTSWIFTGDYPYLNNDTNSYISSVTVGNCSWFHFQDTNLTQTQTAYLTIECA